MENTTTSKLAAVLSEIKTEKDMEKYLDQPKITDHYRSFHTYFRSRPSVLAMESGDLIQKSGLERSYYYQVMKGSKNPGRDKVIRLALAAGLTLPETTRALELSENAVLYPRNRRDIILTVAINNHASVDDTNLLLDKYGEEALA